MEARSARLIKLIAIFIVGIAVVLVGLRLIGFEISNYPPDRRANVPSDTEWSGGVDGGVWVRCADVSGSEPQLFKCDIYGENGSSVLSDSSFRPFKVTWDRNNNSAVYEEIRLSKLEYSAWDGRLIHLSNGYALKWLGDWTPSR